MSRVRHDSAEANSSRRRWPKYLSGVKGDAPLNTAHAQPAGVPSGRQRPRQGRKWSSSQVSKTHHAHDEGYMTHNRDAAIGASVFEVLTAWARSRSVPTDSVLAEASLSPEEEKVKARSRARKDLPTTVRQSCGRSRDGVMCG